MIKLLTIKRSKIARIKEKTDGNWPEISEDSWVADFCNWCDQSFLPVQWRPAALRDRLKMCNNRSKLCLVLGILTPAMEIMSRDTYAN